MRRVFAIFFVAVGLSLGFFGCSAQPDPWPKKSGKRVLTTFAPIYCFAQNVAGDDAVVLCLPTSKGPHGSAEWDPQDILKFRGADLVLSNGLGLDDVNIKKLQDSAGKNITVFKVGDSIPKDKLLHDEEKPDKYDPHVWLSPALAMDMVDAIAEQLSKLDPAHETGFRDRAKKYKEKIKTELLDHGLTAFKNAKSRDIVTQHDAIQYFKKAFDLNIVGSLRGTDDDAISGNDKEKLIRACKGKRGAVTCEPENKPDEMKELIKSLGDGWKLVVVDPLETAPLQKDSSNPDPAIYVDQMRKDIDNLAEALK
jgi:zinc transport system substrate-binding protein